MKRIIKKIFITLGFQNTSLFWILSNRTYLKNILKNLQGIYPRECPCCGYIGKLKACGHPPQDMVQYVRNVVHWNDIDYCL